MKASPSTTTRRRKKLLARSAKNFYDCKMPFPVEMRPVLSGKLAECRSYHCHFSCLVAEHGSQACILVGEAAFVRLQFVLLHAFFLVLQQLLELFMLAAGPCQVFRVPSSFTSTVSSLGTCGVSGVCKSSNSCEHTHTPPPPLFSFSRMRSEGFPFIVGGLGVGAVFAWLASCRRLSSSLVVCRRLSSSLRLKFAAIGGSFCK